MGIEILFYIFLLVMVFAVTGGAKKSANSKFDKKFPTKDKKDKKAR